MLRAVSTDLADEDPLAAMHHVHVELAARVVREVNGYVTLRLRSGGDFHLPLAAGRDRQRRSEKHRGEERLHVSLLDGSGPDRGCFARGRVGCSRTTLYKYRAHPPLHGRPAFRDV